MDQHAGIEVLGGDWPRRDEVLTHEALAFVATLQRRFGARRLDLLSARHDRRADIAAGERLGFLPSTRVVRDDDSWTVAAPAPGLEDRRVEITGPPTRKMTINALNSGASVWMADFEDSTSPTWFNVVDGQLSLIDAFDRTIDFTSDDGKEYRLGEVLPTVVVRPRGWHLHEAHVLVDGEAVSASLFDFGLNLFHCAGREIAAGQGPYFYLPKLESHLEARLWNDVFIEAQQLLGLARGTIRATVLIETITAAFEMDEILYELREHSAGLNCGRWDYIFSVVKNFAHSTELVLPDRGDITMTAPFMRAYTELLVHTCHRRGAHAIGGMAAFIPDRRDPVVTERALRKVREDKEREAGDGFDGSWVAHPDLVPVCREIFDRVLGAEPNQLDKRRDDVVVTGDDLLAIDNTPGTITLTGLKSGIRVSMRYLEAWLGGSGAVAIDNLMEDAATVEISRSQVWQWVRAEVTTADGFHITADLVRDLVAEQARVLVESAADDAAATRVRQAADLILGVSLSEEFVEFLTVPAYERHLARD